MAALKTQETYPRLSPVPDRLQPLRFSRNQLLAADGTRLVSDGEGSRQQLADFGSSLLERSWTVRKVLRRGIHSLNVLAGGRLLIVAGPRIIEGSSEEGFQVVARIARGSRPLGVCTEPDDFVSFGEYFTNPGRDAVQIFGGSPREIQRLYTFPAGAIRHVHGIFWDRWRAGHWVLTGDDGEEAGLWFSEDRFGHLEPVVRGVQQARAVVVFPRPEGLIVPMDSPLEASLVNLLHVESGHFEKLAVLNGSCLSGVEVGGMIAVSTAVEPSSVNRADSADVWISMGLDQWHQIAAFPAGPWARSRWSYITQYPNVWLTPVDSTSEHLYAWIVSTRDADGVGVRWDLADLLEIAGAGGR